MKFPVTRKRQTQLLFAISAFTLGVSCGQSDSSPAPPRPDVVVILVDTLRSDRLGCYGYPRPTSPVIDSLAEGGVLFEDNTAQSPWTLPSTVSVFQGRYLTNYRDRLDEQFPSMTELFKDAGYATVGLVANCAVDEEQGFARGFDHFDVCDCWEDGDKTRGIDRDIQELREVMRQPVGEVLSQGSPGERPPLFLYIHAYDPHSPYFFHEDLEAELPIREALGVEPADYWQTTIGERGPESPTGKADGWSRAFSNLIADRGNYDQEVRYFDAGLGSLLEDLRELGVSEDAVFALVADHGEGLWDHVSNESTENLAKLKPNKFFYKLHGGNGYQPVMATPFLMWGETLPKGLRVTEPVQNIDLLPTLLELARIEAPSGLHGRSLSAHWEEGQTEAWREFAYCYGSHTISIRHGTSGYKLILPNGPHSERTGKPVELFNIREDPHERDNLAEREPEKLAWLVQTFGEWMETYSMESTMSGGHEAQNSRSREKLAEKLRALGYTSVETGLEEN